MRIYYENSLCIKWSSTIYYKLSELVSAQFSYSLTKLKPHIYIVIQAYYSYNNSCYYASVGEHNLSLVITLKFTFGDFAGGIPVQIKLGNSIFHRFYEEDKDPLLRKIN